MKSFLLISICALSGCSVAGAMLGTTARIVTTPAKIIIGENMQDDYHDDVQNAFIE